MCVSFYLLHPRLWQLFSLAQTSSRVFVFRPVYILRTAFSCGPLSFGSCCIMVFFMLCKKSSFHRPQAWRWNVSLLPSAGYIQPREKRTDCLKGQKTNLTQKIIIITKRTIYAYKTDSFQFVDQWIKNKQRQKRSQIYVITWRSTTQRCCKNRDVVTPNWSNQYLKRFTLICLTPV